MWQCLIICVLFSYRNTTLRISIRLKSQSSNSPKIDSMLSDWWLHLIWGMSGSSKCACVYVCFIQPWISSSFLTVKNEFKITRIAPVLFAGVKHVASTSTRERSSMRVKRLFRMSCTWGCPFSVSTSNAPGVLLRLPLRWVYYLLCTVIFTKTRQNNCS